MAAAPSTAGALSRRARTPTSEGGTIRARPPGFPVVGSSASAGGLDALERFFGKHPPVTGMAFVVVSRLDPDHDSILPDILQRSTSLRVSEAQDHLLLVTFADAAQAPVAHDPKARQRRAAGAAEVLRRKDYERSHAELTERLHAVIEEQQASNEELKSAIEELQSTNEELQSANEELETSHEELQSVNHEPVNVNVELQEKVEQLAEMRGDIRNLLDTSNTGMIFVDKELTIRRFNHEACCVYKLVPTDVGRSLADIKTNLPGDDLLEHAGAIFGSNRHYEREVHTATAAYLARIEPYRTAQGEMQGVVLTFTDITSRVEAEQAVQEARALAEAIVNMVREPLLVLDADLSIISASRSFLQEFDLDSAIVLGLSIYQVDGGQWDLPLVHELLERVLPRQEVLNEYVVERDLRGQGSTKMILNARRIFRERDAAPLLLLAIELCSAPASDKGVQP